MNFNCIFSFSPKQYDESLAAHYGGMESMYGDPHAAHRSALAAAGSHSHHSVSVSPASAAATAAAAHLNSHGAAAAAAAAAAMHHSAAAAAAAAAQHSQSPYHSLGNHVSAQQVGANHMAAAAAAAASSSVPDVHKRDKDAIYGYVTLCHWQPILGSSRPQSFEILTDYKLVNKSNVQLSKCFQELS